MLIRMEQRGYKKSILFAELKHHLRMYPDTFGDRLLHRLCDEIYDCHLHLLTITDWEFAEPMAHQNWNADKIIRSVVGQ